MRTRAKEQGELFIFRTSNGGAKKRATNCEIFPSTWWFFTNTNVWQMRIYPTAWRLGFHLIVFPHSESTLPPPAVWRSRNRRCCAHGFQTGEIGDFGWGFRGDTAGYGKWHIFSLYIYKIAMASIAMWNYQSIFKVHDSHMNLWDEIQTETSTLTKTSASPPELGAISGVSLKFSPYHLVI